MSGFLRRITRSRAPDQVRTSDREAADQAGPGTPSATADAAGEQRTSEHARPTTEQPASEPAATRPLADRPIGELAAPAPGADVARAASPAGEAGGWVPMPGGAIPIPAGTEPIDVLPDRPTSKRRGRLRRRLRHLRRVREVLLRDLGGLVFAMHRFASAEDQQTQNEVLAAKLARLASVDAELRELEALLAEKRPTVLHEPGIGGACPSCGELFGSEAHFCWRCGTRIDHEGLDAAASAPAIAVPDPRPELGPAPTPPVAPAREEPEHAPAPHPQAPASTPAPHPRDVAAEPPHAPAEPRPGDDDPPEPPRGAASIPPAHTVAGREGHAGAAAHRAGDRSSA